MKKIIQFLPYSYHIHTWGLEKIAQTISDGLNKNKDFSCLNIASDIRRWHSEPLENFSDDTIFIPSFDLLYNFPVPKFRTKAFREVMRKIKTYKPDVIQTHTRFFVQSMLGWIIAKWLSCKRVHVEHGSWFVTWYDRYIKLAAWCFDWTIGLWIFRQCDTIVTISQSHKTFIKKFTHKEPIVIYNPIDYIPQTKIKNAVPHIGFIWRLVSLKGVDILIKALKQIEKKEWTCTIVWEGNQEKNLKHLTQSLWLEDRIIFVWADDRANWLHRFDIFVNPSYQEWLPTTVVEALIAWCVVVATDVGGTREIRDGQDLLLIQKWDSKKLRFMLTTSLDTYKQICWSSQDHVIKKFKINTAIQRYLDIFITIWKK
jgi:glycosyltransferase involved in cell wall biosynthesis